MMTGRSWWRRGRRQAELRREFAFHLDQRVEDLVADGMDRVEAERVAQRELGAVEVFKEECRDAWGLRWWHDARRDVALAWRGCGRRPGFAVAVAGTFALGVGLNSFTLGLADALWLNPGLYPEEERLVFLWEGDNTFASGHDRGYFPHVLHEALADGVPALAGLATYHYSLSNAGWEPASTDTELVQHFLVGPEYFATLRVQPVIGRAFREEDVRGEGARVAILLHDAWRRNFGGDPGVVGTRIRIDSEPHVVVGVMPSGFVPPPESTLTRTAGFDVLLPFTDAFKAEYLGQFGRFVGFNAVGRLTEGASLAQALQQIDAVKERVFPERYAAVAGTEGLALRGRSLGAELTRDWADDLVLLQGAALLVLVLGCVNVGGLIAGRNLGRLRELAVRAALGASKARLIRQLVTESLWLAVVGGALGLGLAWGLHEVARHLGLFRALAVEPAAAWRPLVLGGSMGLAALAGSGAGVLASWPLLRGGDLDRHLKQDARASTAGRGTVAWRDGLVMAQVALAVTLLVASGLLARSFARALQVDPGFGSERLLMAWIKLPENRFGPEEKRDFMLRLDRELRTLPGVEAAALANQPPMNVTGGPPFIVEGYEPGPGQPWARCNLFTVGADFLALLEIPVVRGRGFEAGDFEEGAPEVILVDRIFVERHVPGDDPLGRRAFLNGRWWTIVGVTENVHSQDVTNPLRHPTVYQNFSQRPPWWFVAMLRTRGEPARMIEPLRAAVGRIDPHIGAFNFETMDEVIARSHGGRTASLGASGVFAATALLLVVTGVYGAMAHTVTARTREMGVKLALGASPGRLVREVVRGGLVRFAIGTTAGVAGAMAGARVLSVHLYETSPFEATVYAVVLVGLALTVVAACLGPAWRAARVDPLVALRAE